MYFIFFLMRRRPTRSTLFPNTTPFRSVKLPPTIPDSFEQVRGGVVPWRHDSPTDLFKRVEVLWGNRDGVTIPPQNPDSFEQVRGGIVPWRHDSPTDLFKRLEVLWGNRAGVTIPPQNPDSFQHVLEIGRAHLCTPLSPQSSIPSSSSSNHTVFTSSLHYLLPLYPPS